MYGAYCVFDLTADLLHTAGGNSNDRVHMVLLVKDAEETIEGVVMNTLEGDFPGNRRWWLIWVPPTIPGKFSAEWVTGTAIYMSWKIVRRKMYLLTFHNG
jgi:hypothetical protein